MSGCHTAARWVLLLSVVGALPAPAADAASASNVDSTFADIVQHATNKDRLVVTHAIGAYKASSGRLRGRWSHALIEALDLDRRSPSTYPCARWTCTDSIDTPGHVLFTFGSGRRAIRIRWTYWTGQLAVVRPELQACLDIRDRHAQVLHIVRQALPDDAELSRVALCRAIDKRANAAASPADPSESTVFEEGDPRIEAMPEAMIKVPPAYPELAREAGVDGVVVVRVQVGADGRVTDARVQDSIPMLNDAAVAAVQLWRFRPGRVAGRSATIAMNVPVRFSLH